jgi:hypothetical protein
MHWTQPVPLGSLHYQTFCLLLPTQVLSLANSVVSRERGYSSYFDELDMNGQAGPRHWFGVRAMSLLPKKWSLLSKTWLTAL